MNRDSYKYASPYVPKESRSVSDNLRIEALADKHNMPLWKVEKLLEDYNLSQKGEDK